MQPISVLVGITLVSAVAVVGLLSSIEKTLMRVLHELRSMNNTLQESEKEIKRIATYIRR